MAKIEIFSNIFDVNEKIDLEISEKLSVKEVLAERNIDLSPKSELVEVYDSETDEITYEQIDAEESILKIFANGLEVDEEYQIEKTDVVIIWILPANKNWKPSVGTVISAVAGIAMIIIGGALSVWSGGTAAIIGGYLINGGFATLAGAAISYGLEVYANYHANDNKGVKDDNSEKNPSLSGSKNQPLSENAFPFVIGSPFATPFIVGSPYNEFEYDYDNQGNIIFTDSEGKLKPNILGNTQPQFLLLTAGYAPLFINNIKLNELNFSYNKNKVLVGTLTYKKDADGYLATENGTAIVNVDGEKIKGSEIGDSWNNNKTQIEISQFGENRNIYKNVVKQKNVNATLLYCYSDEYKEVASEKSITWQGGTFPTGMRTNTIKFTDGVPWKIAVGIDVPAGLYKQWNESGSIYYKKIPMNLVVQWRPYYKYVKDNEIDSKEGVDTCYSVNSSPRKITYKFKKVISEKVSEQGGGRHASGYKDKAGGNSEQTTAEELTII